MLRNEILTLSRTLIFDRTPYGDVEEPSLVTSNHGLVINYYCLSSTTGRPSFQAITLQSPIIHLSRFLVAHLLCKRLDWQIR